MPGTISTGLVLDVRYDQATSTFKDYSRNHHTITNNNVTPVRGKYGGAGGYNGSTSYLKNLSEAKVILKKLVRVIAHLHNLP